MIVMGASLGGLQAVQAVLADLPATFALPIVVVLHRHRESDVALIDLLQRSCLLRVTEAIDKQPIEVGSVYVGPPDYHVLIDHDHLALSIDDLVRFARPSIDVLFESASAYGKRVIGVVLTGGGADGALGATAIESAGGTVIVQNPGSAACGDMPAAAIAVTRRAEILELESIASRLMQLAT